MEQYILDWLKEHPEARDVVRAAWDLGSTDGLRRAKSLLYDNGKFALTNPFDERLFGKEEVPA